MKGKLHDAGRDYYPTPDKPWQRIDPASGGFDPVRLTDAIALAETVESTWPRDLEAMSMLPGVTEIEPPPWNEILGPLKSRGGPSGLVLRHGLIAGQWGEPERVEMTFSIAKSYLAVLAGLAVADGLIGDIDDPVSQTVLIAAFTSPHNRRITWRHLLTQTSEWEGTLFDKPDLVDRNRQVGANADNSRKGQHRNLVAPGGFWEYNDVRVNVLSLALLHRFRRPLPKVLKERIMDPIGASGHWQWHAYRNGVVEIEGRPMACVPGGSHWGGGIWIDSYDHARFALLIQRQGRWGDRELLPASWIQALRTPCPIRPDYGFLWWLNTDGAVYPSAPTTSLFTRGAGSHVIWIDPALELIMVARWIDKESVDDLIGAVMAALT